MQHFGFDFRGFHCFAADADMKSWHYLPQSADVQRDDAGKPILSFTDLGSTAYLIFSARWGATNEDIEALRREIAARSGQPDAAQTPLSFAPITSPLCNALIGDGRGTFEIAASSATSGYPPYAAVFDLALEAEWLASARAGVREQAGFLAVEYLARHRMPIKARARFRAPAALMDGLRLDSEDLAEQLDDAIRDGRASIAIEVDGAPDGKISQTLHSKLFALIAATIRQSPAHRTVGDADIAVELEQMIEEPVRAFRDLGTLVAAGSNRMLPGGEDAAD
ncbi:hypothetical protein NKH93_03620 [Mesorhizobium sp. M0954]|uniref:hypothetical protein n=1 Tax=Mesorhizobium sp. M0954 TaxID=2957032 RepID=UPI003338676D